jgi:tRNA (guanine-N7-)-methyltransferase
LGKDGPGESASGRDLNQEKFYGRRKGRPLRTRRQKLLEDLLPRIEIPVPISSPIDPFKLFNNSKSTISVEIGFGGGEHLAWQAAENPHVGFIGAEPFISGVASCLAHISDKKLENVRLYPDDGRPLLAALPEGSIDRVFVLHPDPWRKRRHWERRLIGPHGLDAIARVLKDYGELRVATDHAGYQVWMLRWLQNDERFFWKAKSADDWRVRPADWPETRYEAKAIREGRIPIRLSYQRVARK